VQALLHIGTAHYLVLAGVLFAIGLAGVIARRNLIVVFMSVELMLNAANLTFVAFSRAQGNLNGQVIAFFIIALAAAEVAVGLAIAIALFRHREAIDVDEATDLRL